MTTSPESLVLVTRIVVLAEEEEDYLKFDQALRNKHFQISHLSALGTDVSLKKFQFRENILVEVQFWKMSIYATFKNLFNSSLKKSKAIIILARQYDESSKLENLLNGYNLDNLVPFVIDFRNRPWEDLDNLSFDVIFQNNNLIHLFRSDKQEELKNVYGINSIRIEDLDPIDIGDIF